ncbi:MAG: LacI family transcriptional regulator [Acidobacteriota bacterium]|nr:LacI family transcriptional regulator [Acidobacteriota bacterium]
MRDVADKAGVSVTTVSHVLNETRPVAEATRRRVLHVIAELNYFKNTSARLLVRGKSDLLGLVISDIENPFFPELIKSFESACARERMEVLLCATNYDRGQAEKALRRMLENQVQGVAVMTSQFDEELASQLTGKGIPLVLLGSARPKKNRSSITIDYQKGIADAVQHLVQLGHRAIAIASGPLNQVSALEYQTAVVDGLAKAGLTPFALFEGNHRPESGARAVQTMLTGPRRPTAIFCGNDRMAIGALGAAVELGFRVPGEVSIVGSDDIWMARYCYPALTTVRIPRDTLGQLAFDVLIKMLQSKGRRGTRHVLETQLIERQSTDTAMRKATTMKRINA